MKKYVTKFLLWLSGRLHRRLVYHCVLHLAAEVTSGKYEGDKVDDVTLLVALKRYHEDNKL